MNTLNILFLSAVMFFIGMFGIVVRKNILVVMMSIELMLNAANIAFVAFGGDLLKVNGQIAVFFIITVAAAESAVGLGLVITMFRNLKSINTDDIRYLKQ